MWGPPHAATAVKKGRDERGSVPGARPSSPSLLVLQGSLIFQLSCCFLFLPLKATTGQVLSVGLSKSGQILLILQ